MYITSMLKLKEGLIDAAEGIQETGLLHKPPKLHGT